MTRILYNLLIILMLFAYCGSDSDYKQQATSEINEQYTEDLVSLDLAFGSEKYGTKNEFLLVDPDPSPFQLLVNNNEDILLVDEWSIKIFDKNGIGKKILGRPGYGPGEFEDSPDIFLGPTGYLLALTSGMSDRALYNFYAPDYSYIDKIRIQNNQRILDYVQSKVPDIKSYRIRQIIPLNETEKIYRINYRDIEPIEWMVSVLYENTDGVIELLNFKRPDSFTSHNLTTYGEIFGSLILDIIPGRRLVYINTDDDRHDEQTGSFYYIHIVSLDTREDKIITRKFDAYEYKEELFEDILQVKRQKNEEEHHKEAVKFFKKNKFYPSIKRMKIDGHYVFIEQYTSLYSNIKENKWAMAIDIFDLETGKFIKQVIFPIYLLGKTIKNGYLYGTFQERDESGELDFPELRKYKINPVVYGLPEDPDWKKKK